MATDVGAQYRTSIEVRDPAGVLTNPATKVVTVTLPDQTTATPSITSDGTGLFHADFTISQEGLHKIVWSTTGPITSKTDYENGIVFRSVVGLTEAREYLNLSDTSKDGLLRGTLATATELAESITGTLCIRTFTNDHCPGSERSAIRLPHGPLPTAAAVTSVTSVWPGGPSWNTAALNVYPDSGIIEPVDYRGFWLGPWKATYTGGRTVIPQRWVEAVLEIVFDLWAYQRGQLADPLVPDYSDSTEYAARIPPGYEMPARAKAMLRRGSLPGFA